MLQGTEEWCSSDLASLSQHHHLLMIIRAVDACNAVVPPNPQGINASTGAGRTPYSGVSVGSVYENLSERREKKKDKRF